MTTSLLLAMEIQILQKLIERGRGTAKTKLDEAIKMDVDDIRGRFGDKYDAAIEQMLTYSKSLNPEDFRPG